MPANAAARRARQLVSRVVPIQSVYARTRRARAGIQRAESFWELPVEAAVRMAYNVTLLREPDPEGHRDFVRRVHAGEISRDEMVKWLLSSAEFSLRMTSLGLSLHLSRCSFVRGLPRAARIVDLGGTDLNSENGAMVQMGYPYDFEQLVIVDLPSDERHPIYQAGNHGRTIATRRGPVTYVYQSMTEPSQLPSGGFGLVYSGQSIEHVPRKDGPAVLGEAHRLLAGGGFLALDTPNARATRLQQDDFIDPDHKVEYTHDEMSSMLEAAGFEILEAKGLNYVGLSLEAGVFSIEEAAANVGIFTEIESCYLLTYVCRKASHRP